MKIENERWYQSITILNFVVIKNIINSINQIGMIIICLCKCNVSCQISEREQYLNNKIQLKCGSEICTINSKNGTQYIYIYIYIYIYE